MDPLALILILVGGIAGVLALTIFIIWMVDEVRTKRVLEAHKEADNPDPGDN